jgi:hypothetical protein
VITCTNNVGATIDTDAGECFATIGSGQLFATATDNCATNDLTFTYVVTDPTGATASFTVQTLRVSTTKAPGALSLRFYRSLW